jgi:hypothetical protein
MTLGTPVKLDAATLIDLAERAAQLSVGQWSVALLEQAFPRTGLETLLALPVGARDRLVLMVRTQLLSGPLRSEPVCAECGATYEITLDPVVFGLAGDAPWPDPSFRPIRIDGREVPLRPVNLGDLLAVETVAQPDQAARILAGRVSGEDGSDLALDALAQALETLDPAADIWLETACPECGAAHSVAFDPVHFVAYELRQLSHRILRDVVDIARVFHWSERDILALPDHRRAYYVAEALS